MKKKTTIVIELLVKSLVIRSHCQVSLVGKMSVYCVGNSGFDPGWTVNTLDLTIIEKVLPLL